MNQEVRYYVSKCVTCCANRPEQGQELMLPHEVPNMEQSHSGSVSIQKQRFSHHCRLLQWFLLSQTHPDNSCQCGNSSSQVSICPPRDPTDCRIRQWSQYACDEFKTFATAWEFHHVTSSPHHPESNGRVEAAVKACKSLIKKTEESGEDVQLALLAACNTPVEGLDASPVQLLFGRRTRFLLPQHCSLLQPSTPKNIATTRTKIKRKQKYYHDRHALAKPLPDLPVGSVVRIRLPGQSTWSTGICTKKLPLPFISCLCRWYSIQATPS